MAGQWGEQPEKLLRHYDRTAQSAAHQVIKRYSSSFFLASGLLRGHVRTDIRSLYAVVRIADEIVDGAGHAAGLSTDECRVLLNDYEQQVLQASHRRINSDLILHAYGISARRCGFKDAHIRAFFNSMRRDLDNREQLSQQELNSYIYGSAEVIGLLCLQSFLVNFPVTEQQREKMEAGARRLGAAFQKINFLRDLASDMEFLGRQYFPELESNELNDGIKAELVADIRQDLDFARDSVALLPADARLGVAAALELLSELTNEIDRISATELLRRRVSLSPAHKALVMTRVPRTWLKKK